MADTRGGRCIRPRLGPREDAGGGRGGCTRSSSPPCFEVAPSPAGSTCLAMNADRPRPKARAAPRPRTATSRGRQGFKGRTHLVSSGHGGRTAAIAGRFVDVREGGGGWSSPRADASARGRSTCPPLPQSAPTPTTKPAPAEAPPRADASSARDGDHQDARRGRKDGARATGRIILRAKGATRRGAGPPGRRRTRWRSWASRIGRALSRLPFLTYYLLVWARLPTLAWFLNRR